MLSSLYYISGTTQTICKNNLWRISTKSQGVNPLICLCPGAQDW